MGSRQVPLRFHLPLRIPCILETIGSVNGPGLLSKYDKHKAARTRSYGGASSLLTIFRKALSGI